MKSVDAMGAIVRSRSPHHYFARILIAISIINTRFMESYLDVFPELVARASYPTLMMLP